MWWIAVFWILLVPLVIIEFVVYLKTRKFSWLVYAIALFTFITAVNYTIDVFSLSRNAIIIILLACSALMALIGRQIGKKTVNAKVRVIISIVLFSVMFLLAATSVIFGQVSEVITPRSSIPANEFISFYTAQGDIKYIPGQQATILTRSVTNNFFLPAPVQQHTFRTCLKSASGMQEMYYEQSYTGNEEVGAKSTKEIPIRVGSVQLDKNDAPIELLIYKIQPSAYSRAYIPCQELGEPDWRIPIV